MKITVICILTIMALALVFVRFALPKPSTPAPAITKAPPVPAGSLVDLSKIAYDAKTTVPGTGVTFSYPKEGYYGKGAQLVNQVWTSDLNVNHASFPEIESLYFTSLHDSILNAQQISIRVFRLEKTTDIEDVLNGLGIPGPYYPLPGRFESINGTRYYLQPGKTSGLNLFIVYGYDAYTIVNGRLLIVSFQGGFDASDDNKTPDLVMQFLSRLDFSCTSTSDCSVNSSPIIVSKGNEQ
ncbi:MAG: hypothetical protein WCT10_02015 [Patescibacteria group bacterium]